MNYQAAIRDNTGTPVTNQQVGMRMSILENSTTVYAETHTPTTNDFGLVNLVIGQGTVEQGVFEDIDWANGTYMMQTEVDVTGGTNYVILGAQQLMSVPYALYAEAAGQPASVSTIGDTLFLGDGTSIVIPGISGVNGGLGNGVYIPGGGVIDVDGNSYPTVILGDQEWMAENLRTSKYSNGDAIVDVTGDYTEWNTNFDTETPAFWGNLPVPYGKIYNYYSVTDSRNVCPSGWHSPSLNEWNKLVIYLGGADVAGGKMKLNDMNLWLAATGDHATNNSASNLSGMNVIGPYSIANGGSYYGSILATNGAGDTPNSATFWGISDVLDEREYVEISYHQSGIYFQEEGYNLSRPGHAIRCIKD
jgi:uncharacterized protein (TIGR02145 family)